MRILLIDTSKPEAVVAVTVTDRLLVERRFRSDRTLGRQLLKMIDDVLAEALVTTSDLTRVAVHSGPGHFMSLRTGIVTATSLAQALGIELVSAAGTTMPELLEAAIRAKPRLTITPHYELA